MKLLGKQTKRIAAFVMALLMVVSIVPSSFVTVMAEGSQETYPSAAGFIADVQIGPGLITNNSASSGTKDYNTAVSRTADGQYMVFKYQATDSAYAEAGKTYTVEIKGSVSVKAARTFSLTKDTTTIADGTVTNTDNGLLLTLKFRDSSVATETILKDKNTPLYGYIGGGIWWSAI